MLLDWLFLVVIVAFFIGAAALVRACGWVVRSAESAEAEEAGPEEQGDELEELPLNRDVGP